MACASNGSGAWVAASTLAAGLLGTGLVAAVGRWGGQERGGALPRRATSSQSTELTVESQRGTRLRALHGPSVH